MAKSYDIVNSLGNQFTYQLYANLSATASGDSALTCVAEAEAPPIVCKEGTGATCGAANPNPNIKYRANISADGQSVTGDILDTPIAAANSAFALYTTTTCATKYAPTGTFRTGGIVDGASILLDTYVGNTDCTSIVGFGLVSVGTISEVIV